MVFPPPPVVPARMGCLDDTDFSADGEANAEAIYALTGAANRAKARGGLLMRQLWNVATTGENQGGALSFAWPFWHLATPVEAYPCFKKPGLTTMRFRVRGELTSGRRMLLQVATRARPFTREPPVGTDVADGNVVEIAGSGSFDVDTRDNMHLHPASQELISIFAKGIVDPGSDAAMSTGTYGGLQTGTVDQIFSDPGRFYDASSSWNTSGSQVHTGGHYVVFSSAGDAEILWGPCAIIDVERSAAQAGEGLFFVPAPSPQLAVQLVGSTYDIYKLPDWRAGSMVAYEADGAP